MKYALGNMLNGAGGSNADGLALDLQFATDKTITARKGPTPTFTRASSGTFVGSNGLIQSAAINAPRFDHDPVTLACKGLLIEESRTNSQRNSADFSLWTNGIGTTTTTNQTTSPDGTSTADVFAETIANTQHFISDTLNVSVTSGTAYTLSVFAKKGIGSTAPDLVQITGSGGAFGTTQYATFNIQNGSVNSSAGGAATIQSFGNGWYRLSFTVSATATTTTALLISFVGLTPASRLPSYVGLVTSDMYLWGAQLEAGSFATSYIPTTTASVIRSADVCSISGSDFTGMYNATEGSVISQGSIENLVGNNRGMWGINNNTVSHGFLTLYGASGGGILSQSRNTTATALPPTFANSASTSFKRGLTYYSGGASISTNGATATDTVVTNSTQTMLTLQIGNMLAGAFYWSGHIASIRYFKKRLANAKLQSLTA